MKTEYIVIDETGNASYSTKTESPESFTTYRAAEKRAKGLASLCPGDTIRICEVVAEVNAPVGKVAAARKYPREHYA